MLAKANTITDNDLITLWQFGQQPATTAIIIERLCNCFLGTPYELLKDPIFHTKTLEQLLTCLAYDDEPEVAAVGFDCVTFVETILALTLAMHSRDVNTFKAVFQANLMSLRYREGIPGFLRRNYFFTCVDWTHNNKWLVKDITQEIGQNIAYAKTKINKLSWLYHYKLLLPYKTNLTITDLADKLAKINVVLPTEDSVVPYIPSDELLTNFNKYILAFPDIAIINIVRPDWDVTELYENYGTHLNISHLGICLKKQDELYFYHATSVNEKTVIVEKLTAYLTRYLNSPTVKGINVLSCKF